MKILIFFFALLFLQTQVMSQKTYTTILEDDGTKIMKGLVSKEVLLYEPGYTWYADNEKNYIPNAEAVNALKLHTNDIQILAFGGTWCSDTKFILPKFYTLITSAGFNQSNLTLWGVDRSKKTYGALAEALGVTNVPTFIILKGGKELGRVVEYGKTGQWDKEIGEIVKTAK